MTAVPSPIYKVGSLTYTPGALITLFGWLIWGDFILVLMEAVLPNLLPLILQANGASKRELVVMVTTLAMIMNAALNPIISYNSDRFRSRWGRRRPFIVATTPFVVLFLAAVPFAPDLFHWITSHDYGAKLLARSPVPPLMLVFGALVVAFQTFNMFVSSVYYYLVPDVVPPEVLGRFYALFRVFGSLASIVFNYFIFGLAENHAKAIFVTIALVYGFFILLMCSQVKEGKYPPPIKEDHGHWWSGIRNYAGECFGFAYYWWVFLVYSALIWAGISGVFAVFFFRDEVGLTLDMIGKAGAWGSALFLISVYPYGILLDRWGCHKVYILSAALVAASSILMFFFAVGKTSAMAWMVVRTLTMGLAALATNKWTVEVYPRDRYGQFGSAGALFSSIGGILLGPVCAWWMGSVGSNRYFLLWSAFFAAMGAVAAVVVHGKWKALGGPKVYRAP